MAAACNNKDFADKVGMDRKVACDFFKADQKLKEDTKTFLEHLADEYTIKNPV